MALGGRAAEEIIFGKISTGALSDLERVTKMAYNMVTIYGMNNKLGNLSYYDPKQPEYSFGKPYSEATAEIIDQEVSTKTTWSNSLASDLFKRLLSISPIPKAKIIRKRRIPGQQVPPRLPTYRLLPAMGLAITAHLLLLLQRNRTSRLRGRKILNRKNLFSELAGR